MNDRLLLEKESAGWWESRNKNAALLLVFVTMLAAKLITLLLPDKYFYDNNRILGMANDSVSVNAWGGSYVVAANFFKKFNLFGFTDMSQWSWFLGMALTSLVFLMVLRLPEIDMVQTVFLLACVGLLNIYVFNIGKDVIQFLFFFAVYVVLLLPIRNQLVKIMVSVVLLYFESKVFRSYYILIAALVLAVYCMLVAFRHVRNLRPAIKIVLTVSSLYLLVCMVMVVSQVVMPDEYNQIINVRNTSLDGREGDADAVTIIQNWVGSETDTSLPLFLVNYLINAIRMMIPFELAVKGVQYLPFFCFQFAVTIYLVHLFGKLDKIDDGLQFMAVAVFLGYLLASPLFEPDFGSWVRHESATFPILHLLVFSPNQRISQWKQDINKVRRKHAATSHVKQIVEE